MLLYATSFYTNQRRVHIYKLHSDWCITRLEKDHGQRTIWKLFSFEDLKYRIYFYDHVSKFKSIHFSFRNYSNITIKSVGTFCYISGGINTSVDADSTDHFFPISQQQYKQPNHTSGRRKSTVLG